LVFPVLFAACTQGGASPDEGFGGASGATADREGGEGGGGGGGAPDDIPADDVEPNPVAMAEGGAGGAGGAANEAPGGGAGATGMPALDAPAVGPLTIDFEQFAAGSRPGEPFTLSPTNAYGVVEIDDERAHSGMKSLFIEARPYEESAGKNQEHEVIVNLTRILPKPVNRVHLRVMIYVDGAPGSGHYDLVRWIGTFSCQQSKISGWVSFGGFTGEQKYQLFGRDPASGHEANCKKGAPQAIQPGRWTCLQLKLDAKGSPTHQVVVDGVPIAAYSVDAEQSFSSCEGVNPTGGRFCSPEITLLRFGYRHVNEQKKTVKLWYDDLVIDDEPVPCPGR
jgi:hypothetical protein